MTKTTVLVTPIIVDKDNAGSLESIGVYLNNNLVKSLTENLEFSDLLSNTTYTIKAIYKYNLNNGSELLEIEKEVTTLSVATPIVDIELSSTKNEISYSVLSTDADNVLTISKINLLKDNVVVNSSTELEGSFVGLLANATYQVQVEYNYNLNDGNGLVSTSYQETISTDKYTTPSVGINITNLTDLVVEGNLVVSDIDNVYTLASVSIYHADMLEESVETETFKFSILPNVEYRIVVTYTYNLNDGNGTIQKVVEYSFAAKKQIPTIDFNAYLVTSSSIEYNLIINDVNITGRLNSIMLYQDNAFVSKIDNDVILLENLQSNTNYKLVVNYVYDLDDGEGSKEINKEFVVKTLKVTPTYELGIDAVSKTSFSIYHNISDVDYALRFKELNVYLGDTLYKKVTTLDDVRFAG